MPNAATPPQASDFLVYMNLEHGIWMKYPSSWERIEQPGAAGFAVVFLSPQEDPFDEFRENLNIFVEPLPQPMTLEQVVAASGDTVLQQFQATFLEKATKDQIGGRPAYRTVYTGSMMERALKWLQYYVVSGNRAYYVTYTSEPAKYDLFLPMVQQMLGSLEIG